MKRTVADWTSHLSLNGLMRQLAGIADPINASFGGRRELD